MPELPEVEVTRQGLLSHLPGRRVIRIQWSGKRLRTAVPVQLLQKEIKQQLITTIDRRAKYLLVRMASEAVLVIHLGMSGKLRLFADETPLARHDHLALQLDNGLSVRLNDVRRFGRVMVWPAAEAALSEQDFSNHEGIEPLGEGFTSEKLFSLARKRTIPVKTMLMNSRLIAGVGNIYANETLFKAGIHPESPARGLNQQQWQAIITHCRTTLEQAIAAGGTTISDFLGASGRAGYFQLQLSVYGKKDAPCPSCRTPISKKNLAGRATFFCSHCQPLSSRKKATT
ncbi:bifunctional DNA-formamidopyrimidine glycosylase/DNA-(apurinic or apyrimidinic site) lyase [Desulfogranum mediterraneum]|uniref:bifunctional DNA-formamidopyrimidine glycosylase/DNA-(apurinic or apyrimidinic site) lyase n=1 Tax=Desulfogranum mediterraneum TaxID=160661 RepID=UPI000413EF68|nr:bifunctional DNA-formamidopyrimidine glycosylase/DNA-(apurinic or apyrimidinic site) lyase [Desulfogranum mediterraneum]